jgi:uncharacterized protein
MQQVPLLATAASGGCAVVLDTNTVLDWLVFDDPGARAVGAAVLDGALVWHASARMHDELAHVLARPGWTERGVVAEATVLRARALSVRQLEPSAVGPLRCRDPDDQVFLDLAIHLRARWLFTRDKDLLSLARAAHERHGLVVMPASKWALPMMRSG